jgi:hypothetical protein
MPDQDVIVPPSGGPVIVSQRRSGSDCACARLRLCPRPDIIPPLTRRARLIGPGLYWECQLHHRYERARDREARAR